jgi:hypothetical protein
MIERRSLRFGWLRARALVMACSTRKEGPAQKGISDIESAVSAALDAPN